MRKLVWIAAWTGIAMWSLFAVASYGLFEFVSTMLTGGVAARPPAPDTFTTGEPHIFEWLYPFVQVGRALGLSAIVAAWLTVTAMILGGAFLLTRFIPAAGEGSQAVGTRRAGRAAPVIETTWDRHPEGRDPPAPVILGRSAAERRGPQAGKSEGLRQRP